MLDVSAGVVTRIADSRDHFATMIDVGDNANNWLVIPLVDQCVAAGLTLADNQCYGYKAAPALGGQYSVENIEPTDLSTHYSFLAHIFRQTRDLLDGSRVRIRIG
jgi:hypothetical protein